MKLLQRVVEFIAPAECLVCGHEGQLVCDACLPKAVVTKRLTCYRCNRLSPGGKTCNSCRSSTKLAGVVVASHYDGVIKQLIQALKFRSAVGAEITLAKLITPLLDPGRFDIIVSVPTAAERYRRRGFNQAGLIGRQVAAELALPYSVALLRLGSARQLGHNRQERLRQLADSIVLLKPADIAGRRVLVIDDVVTTGATLAECAKVLKAAGAKSVWGAAVAKH